MHYVTHYIIIITFVVSNITKYTIKTGNITQATLLTNVTRYLTVTSLILSILLLQVAKLLISLVYPLSNA